MDVLSSSPTQTEPQTDDAERHVFRLAARTWLALQTIDVPPSPHNFELWFIHLEGTNPELSRRMKEMLQNGHRPVPEVLELIYAECISSSRDTDFEMLEDGIEEIEQVAGETATQLADGHRYLHDYGVVLSTVGVHLDEQQTVDSLVKTVATLAAETTRASELNRSLEARLSASASKVQRLRQSLAQVKEETATDALTRLLNRRGFDTRLRRAIVRHNSENTPVCLLIADVDRFKAFNDTYGHRTGDLVLRLVGRLLSENVKGKDTAARYGGEEFALILIGADEHAGSRVAEQIRAALDGKRLINRGSGQHLTGVTMSIGVAELRPNERSASWIERADAALYKAKNTGRNKVCISSSL